MRNSTYGGVGGRRGNSVTYSIQLTELMLLRKFRRQAMYFDCASPQRRHDVGGLCFVTAGEELRKIRSPHKPCGRAPA